MPSYLGYSGASTTPGNMSNGYVRATGPFTATEDGAISSVDASFSGDAGSTFSLAVYEDNGAGYPGSRVCLTGSGSFVADGWHSLAATGQLVKGHIYWIAIYRSSATALHPYYKDSATGYKIYYEQAGPPANPYAAGDSVLTNYVYLARIGYVPISPRRTRLLCGV